MNTSFDSSSLHFTGFNLYNMFSFILGQPFKAKATPTAFPILRLFSSGSIFPVAQSVMFLTFR